MVVRDGELAMRQEGRPELLVHRLGASMTPGPDGPRLRGEGRRSRLGPSRHRRPVHARFHRLPAPPDGRSAPGRPGEGPADPVRGRERLEIRRAAGTGRGRAGLRESAARPGTSPDAITLRTTAIFQGTTVGLPTLGLPGEEATGRLTVHDKIVRLEDVRGRMVGGHVAISGPIDLRHKPDSLRPGAGPRRRRPHRLARVVAAPSDRGPRPVHRQGRAAARPEAGRAGPDRLDRRGHHRRRRGPRHPAGAPGIDPPRRRAFEGRGTHEPLAPPQRGAVPPPMDRRRVPGEGRRARPRLRAGGAPGKKGGPREVPVSGRLGLEATAGSRSAALDDLTAYQAHGSADVAGATIGGLDLGRLTARLDLAGGILEVADLRGRMVDRPEGRRPARADRAPARRGPPAPRRLPRPGPRRADRRTQPPGRDGRRRAADRRAAQRLALAGAPLGAPDPPRACRSPAGSRSAPRPAARGASSWDPHSWTLSGHAEMPEVAYRSTRLKDVSSRAGHRERPAGAPRPVGPARRCRASRAGSASSWPSPGRTTASSRPGTCPARSCSAWSRTRRSRSRSRGRSPAAARPGARSSPGGSPARGRRRSPA